MTLTRQQLRHAGRTKLKQAVKQVFPKSGHAARGRIVAVVHRKDWKNRDQKFIEKLKARTA